MILERAGARTVVVALHRPVLVERFDRVVVLRKGTVDFDGAPQAWQAWRAVIREVKRA